MKTIYTVFFCALLMIQSAYSSTSCEQNAPKSEAEASHILQEFFSNSYFKNDFSGSVEHSESKVRLLVAIHFMHKYYPSHPQKFTVEELSYLTGVDTEEIMLHMKGFFFFGRTKLAPGVQSAYSFSIQSALIDKFKNQLLHKWVEPIDC